MRFIISYLLLFLSFFVQAQSNSYDDFVKHQIEQLNLNLKYYTSIYKCGNWKQIKISKDSLIKTSQSPDIKKALKNNLCLMGDLPERIIHISPEEEDSAIFYALKYFQLRHGLQETGVLDIETLKELNTPICNRIEQIKLNIKRWENFLIKGEYL